MRRIPFLVPLRHLPSAIGAGANFPTSILAITGPGLAIPQPGKSLSTPTCPPNAHGVIDELDLAIYLETNCTHFDSKWVFSVADLVVVDNTITNDNVKLMKLRFYPVATTELNG